MSRYILIGSGVAGIAAAEAVRGQDSAADMVMVGDEAHGFYSRPGLAYYLTGELGDSQLYPFDKRDFQRLKLTWQNAQVARIRPHEHRLSLHNGAVLPYDRLLIATGAKAARSSLPGIELEGVVKLDNLDDARRILKLAKKARSAVVIGGGITALEIVEGLVARGVKTHYLLRGDRYWGNVLDETESRLIERRLKEEGVQIHFHTEVAEILEKKGRVAGVRTVDGRRIDCGLAAFAIGIQPRKELAEAAGLRTDRGVLVDEYMRTSDADIFAAGDVAQVFDPATGQSVLDSLWGPAREQGRAAGLNMAGLKTAYRKPVAFNVTRLANLTITIIGSVGHGRDDDLMGIARGDSETWRQLPAAMAAQANFDVNRLRVLVGERKLIGAIVMGDQTLSQPLQHLITRQVDITPIRERLLRPDAAIGDLIAEFWTEYCHAAQQS